jgi:signal transduction histidine kinase
MIPLSLMILITLGLILPTIYKQYLISQFQGENRILLQKISRQLSQLAQEKGRLWSYDYRAIHRIITPLISQNHYIEIEFPLTANDPQKIQWIRFGDAQKQSIKITQSIPQIEGAQLSLSFPENQLNQPLMLLYYLAILFALGISSLIFFIPLRVVKKADLDNQRLLQALKSINLELEDRVMLRTSDLERLSERLMNIQEEERARISRDLHDELGQTLTGLRLYLTILKQLIDQAQFDDTQINVQQASEQASQYHAQALNLNQCLQILQQAMEGVDFGVEQVRNIAYQMRPPELDSLGLKDAILAHIRQKSEQYHWQYQLHYVLTKQPNQAQSDICFRLVQEALTNVARHAQATEIEVKLFEQEKELILEVIDNGIGLKQDFKRGIGLNGALARLKMVNGKCELFRQNHRTIFKAHFLF